jgi:hypothetical protein
VFDVNGYREIDRWRLGPSDQFFESVAFLTNNWPSLGIGLASFIAVLHRRRTKPALSLLIAGTVVAAIAWLRISRSGSLWTGRALVAALPAIQVVTRSAQPRSSGFFCIWQAGMACGGR